MIPISKDLSEDLEAKELQGRAVTLKIKTDGFQVKTRVKNLLEWTADAAVIGSAARALLRQFMEEMRPLRLRLMGVRVSATLLSSSVIDLHSDTQSAIWFRQYLVVSSFRQNVKSTLHFSCPNSGASKRAAAVA